MAFEPWDGDATPWTPPLHCHREFCPEIRGRVITQMCACLLAIYYVKVAQSCPTLCDSVDNTAHGILQARILKVGNCSLVQGNFPTQGLNPGPLHCRQILYQLSHQGSPRILEWVAFPFSMESSQPKSRTQVSCIAGRFFTS